MVKVTYGPAGVGLGEGLPDPYTLGAGDGVGLGVGDGEAEPLGEAEGDPDGDGVTNCKFTKHEKPWSSGHLKPLGASATAYVTTFPGGVVAATDAEGCGETFNGPGVAGICALTGGLTPPGADSGVPKLP
jgi:hypothetical protein